MNSSLLFDVGAGFGIMNAREAREMVGVSVRDDDAVDRLPLFAAGPAKAGREVSGKELIITSVDQHHRSVRGLEHRAVALLHVNGVELQDAGFLGFRRHDVFQCDAAALRRRLHKADLILDHRA